MSELFKGMELFMEIEIEVIGKGKTRVRLDDKNPETAICFNKSLPFKGKANLWLEEVYFFIPLELEYENQFTDANKGDLSYWPSGTAIRVFYGGSQPAYPVNPIGKITFNLELFGSIQEDYEMVVRKI